MSRFGKGYKRDTAHPPHPAIQPFSAHDASGQTATTAGVDLRPSAPAVKDQGQCSGCTGHGTSTGISTRCRVAGVPLSCEPSEKGVYDVARCTARAAYTAPSLPLPPLTDDGAEPNWVIRGIAEWGIRPSRAPAPDGRNSDCDQASINVEPKLDELEADAKALAVGAYRIESTGRARVEDVKRALAAGLPVCFGVFVDTAFEDWDPSKGPIGAPNKSDPNGGGHWLCCLGFTTNHDGSVTFIVRNSWGVFWGLAGDCLVSEAHCHAWGDVYALDVTIRAENQGAAA